MIVCPIRFNKKPAIWFNSEQRVPATPNHRHAGHELADHKEGAMTEDKKAKYHAQREQQERALAAAADEPSIRAIHLELADRHAELASKDRPTQRVRLSISTDRGC